MGMSYPTAREEQAAYWYLKLQDPQVSAEDIQAALAWQADPENRAAFERVEVFWRAWPQDMAASAESTLPKRARRSAWLKAVAAAIAIVSIGVWFVVGQSEKLRDAPAREYATSIGQTRVIELEDGTKVVLGGATSIRTSFLEDVRRVAMADGEALFFVAKDSRRPFIVDLPNGSVQAIGTAFNVHRGPDEATFTVLEGIVHVKPPSWRAAAGIRLQAGAQVALSPEGTVGRVREVNPQEVASWQSGRMIFVDRTLRSVIADLNRYSRKPVALAAMDSGDIRVSGNINLNQIEDWLRALGPALDLDLVQNESGLSLVSRNGPPQ
jgi:transmembrane sensor